MFQSAPAGSSLVRRGGRSARRRSSVVATAVAALLIVAASPVAASRPATGIGSAVPSAIRVPAPQPGARVIVTYRDAASYAAGGRTAAARVVERVEALRMKVFAPTLGLEAGALRELAAEAGVVAIENDVAVESTLVTPNDPLWSGGQRWAHDRVGLRTAWSSSRGSSGVVIAILDSGLETSHPEFAGRIVSGYDFVEGDTVPNDPRGHGTMSAGAAAARGNNGFGVAGGCWECRIMPLRVLNANGNGYGRWVVRAIVHATDHGADVISMSFGGFSPTSSMAGAIDYARSRGVVVVASAGNDGDSRAFYPAAYPGVIGVAASDPSDRPYSWSNRGSRYELAAPGCFSTTKTGRSYGTFCGTSASAPLVAGIVGILRAARPDLKGYLVERALLSTATPLSYVSHGRPNAAAAMRATLATVKPKAPAPPPAGSTHAWVESGGQVVIEAERANERIGRSGSSWIDGAVKAGFAGSGYVAAWEDRGAFFGTGYTTTAPELRYRVKFSRTGVYTIWVRTWAPDAGGDSIHIGVNGQDLKATDRISTGLHGYWAWTRSTMDGPTAQIRINEPGVHTINVWAREDGFRFDRLVITQGGAPVGKGPAESATVAVPR